jgi:hypothetical protein
VVGNARPRARSSSQEDFVWVSIRRDSAHWYTPAALKSPALTILCIVPEGAADLIGGQRGDFRLDLLVPSKSGTGNQRGFEDEPAVLEANGAPRSRSWLV